MTRTDTLSCFTGAPSISFCLTMFSISGCTLSICDMCAVVKISLQALQPGSEDVDTRNLRWMNACDDFELFETAAIALFSELQLSSVASRCIACGSTALIRLANPQHCHTGYSSGYSSGYASGYASGWSADCLSGCSSLPCLLHRPSRPLVSLQPYPPDYSA